MSVLFDHCMCISPEGSFMFYCSKKKADFYVKNKLATIVREDPFVFRLNFIPKGIGSPEEKGILKANICISCNAIENLTRHHIVPLQYRKKFSIKNKEHQHWDIIAMCEKCHREYERQEGSHLRKKLENNFAKNKQLNALFFAKRKTIRVLEKANIPEEIRKKLEHRLSTMKEYPDSLIDIDMLIIEKYSEEVLSDLWRKNFQEWLFSKKSATF